jgi:hypothetical protein
VQQLRNKGNKAFPEKRMQDQLRRREGTAGAAPLLHDLLHAKPLKWFADWVSKSQPPQTVAYMPPALVLVRRVPHGGYSPAITKE